MNILVGDDQQDILDALQLLLKGAGHRSVTADSPATLLAAARRQQFDLILIDLNYARDTTSGQEGLDLLASLQSQQNDVPVVVMTAWGNIDLAVEAMRRGASDFVQKPWDNARLLASIESQTLRARQSHGELDVARTVQQRLLRHKAIAIDGVEYAGRCAPAREVGGDYFDFLDLGSGRLGMVLADVCGKGVPAALLMSNLQACFRTHVDGGHHSTRGMLRSINNLFFESTAPEHFATAFYCEYDTATLRVHYVNCGHPAPTVLRAGRGVESLEATATVLGAFLDWDCEEATLQLEPGDTLVAFSDGVTEAESATGECFGDTHLRALLARLAGQSAETVVDRLIEAAQQFADGAQADDVTCIALRRQPLA